MQIYEIFSSNGPMTQMWADDQLKVLIDDSMRCNFWKSLVRSLWSDAIIISKPVQDWLIFLC